MLDAFYATLFKPGETRLSLEQTSPLIGLLVILVLSLNAAGRFHTGLVGFILTLFLFLAIGLFSLFWLTASLFLCAQVFDGQGTAGQTGQALVRGLWPLIFSGVAIATAKALPALGALETFAIFVGTTITVTGGLRHAHQLSWFTSFRCVLMTLFSAPLVLLALLLGPTLLILGS